MSFEVQMNSEAKYQILKDKFGFSFQWTQILQSIKEFYISLKNITYNVGVNNILLQLPFIYPSVLYFMRAKSDYSINIKCDCSLNFYFLNEATESQPRGVNSLLVLILQDELERT